MLHYTDCMSNVLNTHTYAYVLCTVYKSVNLHYVPHCRFWSCCCCCSCNNFICVLFLLQGNTCLAYVWECMSASMCVCSIQKQIKITANYKRRVSKIIVTLYFICFNFSVFCFCFNTQWSEHRLNCRRQQQMKIAMA